MCVIAIKYSGINIPNEVNIQDMWDRNSDGAGFMYVLKGAVNIEKGFMTLKDFNRGLAYAEKKIIASGTTVLDTPMILHFRIGTHGGNIPANTHPFPVVPSLEHLKALDVITDLGIVHNGIIDSVKPRTGISDTMEYIKSIICPIRSLSKDFLENPQVIELFEKTIAGSKLAFLDGEGKIKTVGTFVESNEDDLKGIKYSNLHHEISWGNYLSNYTNTQSSFSNLIVKRIPDDIMKGRVGLGYQDKTYEMSRDAYYIDKFGYLYGSPVSKKGECLVDLSHIYYAVTTEDETDYVLWEDLDVKPTIQRCWKTVRTDTYDDDNNVF